MKRLIENIIFIFGFAAIIFLTMTIASKLIKNHNKTLDKVLNIRENVSEQNTYLVKVKYGTNVFYKYYTDENAAYQFKLVEPKFVNVIFVNKVKPHVKIFGDQYTFYIEKNQFKEMK